MSEHAAPFLRDLGIILMTAAFATVVFQRLRLPVIAGYLVAGVLVGELFLPRLIEDPAAIRGLAEAGVVLLMLSVGLELRLRRLARLGPRIALTALVEVGFMVSLGLVAARMLGWGSLDGLLAAGIVGISSTMVIAKVFEGRKEDWRLRDLVFGILVMEDLVAVALIAICTTVAFGAQVTAGEIAGVLSRLGLVLAVMLLFGLLVVVPVIRMVVHRSRSETVLVTTVGLSFMAAIVTQVAGFSVALGAFIAGLVISEAGVGHQVAGVIKPVRDLFAAVFFVAVGMLLDLGELVAVWPLVLFFTGMVVAGKIVGVSLGGFVNGFGVRSSVKAGMSMAQIGEFSFIIAGLGATSAIASAPLYPIAVSTALLTTFLTPLLVARSDRVALWVDRRLPKPLQTFASLYAAWIESLPSSSAGSSSSSKVRRLILFLVVDVAALTGLLIGAGIGYRRAAAWLARIGLTLPYERLIVAGGFVLLAVPFALGFAFSVRRLSGLLAELVVPPVAPGKVDQGRAPRRVLVIALEIGMVLVAGIPVVAVTLPFLPPWGGLAVVATLVLLLGVALWRTALDLDRHARAGAELVVHMLARQGVSADAESFDVVRGMLPGLGNLVPLRIDPGSEVVGRTLGDLNIRGRTGATVVALCRGTERQVFPPATASLEAGDLIAVTGSQTAISRAEDLVHARGTSTPPTGTAATDGRAS